MEAGHDLDLSQIDELDEIDGDQQFASVWCDTHRKFEWHWIDCVRPSTAALARRSQRKQLARKSKTQRSEP